MEEQRVTEEMDESEKTITQQHFTERKDKGLGKSGKEERRQSKNRKILFG